MNRIVFTQRQPENQPPADSQQEDLATPAPYAARLDRVERLFCHPLPEQHVLFFGQHDAAEQERFRVLCHHLEKIRQQQRHGSVLITSAVPREGKTVVALNLASALARSGSLVLLVDADMRRASIHQVLGLRCLPGLAEVLKGSIEVSAAYRAIDPFGFYYLSSGHAATNPVELLQRPELKQLMNEIVTVFEWIVFDSPPLNVVADARYVAALASTVLLVVREGFTPKEAVEQSRAALDGAFVAGIVLNASTERERDYNYYHASNGFPHQARLSPDGNSSSSKAASKISP